MPSLPTLASPFSWPLLLCRCHTLQNIPLDSLGQLSWLCPVPRSRPPSAHWWEGDAGGTAVMLSQQTPTCYQLLYSYQYRAQHWGLLWGELISPQPDPRGQKAYKLGEVAIETATRLFRTSRQTVRKKASNSCCIHRPISTGIQCQLLGAIRLL